MDRVDWFTELFGEQTETVPYRNGPELWEALLEATDEPEAVVAGGCIRDYLLNLEPKDIDIFVPISSRQEFEVMIASLNDSGKWSLEIMEDTKYHLSDPSGLIGVAEGEGLGVPVNIISRVAHLDACPWDLIRSFDYHILQWSFQSQHRAVVGTTQALMDLANRTATLAHDDTPDLSIQRFERFAARNPGALRLVAGRATAH